MISNPKISVVIPVYNASEYLQKCLDSLVYQTYSNLEIICINDGSTDSSLEILEEYAKKDSRIVIKSQENSGASVARNFGMKVATGDYISFVDADDWVYLNLYQSFVDAIQKSDVEIWMFNVASYVEGVNDVAPRVFFEATDWNNHESDDVIHTFDDCKRPFSRNLAVYNKIYKRSFLESCELTFPEGLKYEDQFFILKAFLNAKSIKFTEDAFYRYRNYHQTSITCNVSPKTFDIFDIVDLVEEEINRLGVYETYKYALFQYKYTSYFQQYLICPNNLKQQYFETMKGRLLAAETQGLYQMIASRLANYQVFLKIKNSTFNEFDGFMTKLQSGVNKPQG